MGMSQKPKRPDVSARVAFQDYINEDGLIDVEKLNPAQRKQFLSYITVAQVENHLERLTSDSGSCHTSADKSHNECKRKLNRTRRHAKEHLAQFLNNDGFLELSRLSPKDKRLLLDCVNESTLDQFIEAFETFDLNDDESISSSELRIVLKSLGIEPTEDVLNDILSEVDADGNGVVDIQEFLVFMASRLVQVDCLL